MVLTSYATRTFPETRYLEDTTQRNYASDSTWASCTNLTVNPGSDTLMHFRVKSRISTQTTSGTYTFVWKFRLKDSTTVVWSGQVHSFTSPTGTYQYSPDTYDGFYYMVTAGSHTLYLEYALYRGGASGTQRLEQLEFRVGQLALKNLTASTKSFSSVSCPASAMTTLISAGSITVPASSSLFYGSIKNFNVICLCYITPDTATACSWVDAGDKYVASQLSYFVEFGSTPWDWSIKSDESTYGVDMKGTTGVCGYSAEPSEALTLTLKVYNATASTRTLSGYVVILISPWLTTYNHHAPWDLPDLPLGSTVYFTIDPEAIDSDSTIYAGARKKVLELGTGVSASDYLGVTSKTSGIQTLSYSFDRATPGEIDVMVRSKIGVINRITLDIV